MKFHFIRKHNNSFKQKLFENEQNNLTLEDLNRDIEKNPAEITVGKEGKNIASIKTKSLENVPGLNVEGITAVNTEDNDYNSLNDMNNEDDGKFEGIRLKKKLKPRHISMIAIGGSLGTGLLIGTGRAFSTAGPLSTLIAYSFVGIIVFFTISCIGEMAAYIPLDGFTSYATRYCDPALGFAVGYAYMIKYFILPPNQLTAAALVMQYWVDPQIINPGVWIAIMLVVITLINFFGIKFFGEFEFWLSSCKIIIMIVLIILLVLFSTGVNKDHSAIGFKYLIDPGGFKPYAEIYRDTGDNIALAKFVAFVSVLIYGVFAYLGIELTGIVAAEASNPRKSIPKAVNLTIYRIIIFYVVTIFLLGLNVSYNDPQFSIENSAAGVASSPFLIAIINSGFKILPDFFNACILIFVFSAANSDLYVASRNLYSLAIDNKAPKIFAATTRWGLPYYALIVSTLFCLLAFMSCSEGSSKIFNYFVNVVSIVGILTWISILITFLRFYKACKKQNVNRKTFSYRSPIQPYGAWFSLIFCCLIALIKNFTVFIGNFDVETFITGYICLPVFLICYFGYKIVYKTKIVPPAEVDLITFKNIIDRDEIEHDIKENIRKEQRAKAMKGNLRLTLTYRFCNFIEKFI